LCTGEFISVVFVGKRALVLVELVKNVEKRLAVFKIFSKIGHYSVLAGSLQVEVNPTD
jgi:hypothetical protein